MSEESQSSEVPTAFTEVVHSFAQLPENRRLVAAYEFARDIAYGDIGSRNPFDVLAAHKGTCSGKHALLKLFLEHLGYDVQSWFAKHNFGAFPITQWPAELMEFKDKNIPDYHDFLKVKVGKEWLTIDGVFDKTLVKLGFPALEWDGKTDMQLPVIALEIFPAGGDMETHKKKLIGLLPTAYQDQRKKFLSTLTAWLDANRSS